MVQLEHVLHDGQGKGGDFIVDAAEGHVADHLERGVLPEFFQRGAQHRLRKPGADLCAGEGFAIKQHDRMQPPAGGFTFEPQPGALSRRDERPGSHGGRCIARKGRQVQDFCLRIGLGDDRRGQYAVREGGDVQQQDLGLLLGDVAFDQIGEADPLTNIRADNSGGHRKVDLAARTAGRLLIGRRADARRAEPGQRDDVLRVHACVLHAHRCAGLGLQRVERVARCFQHLRCRQLADQFANGQVQHRRVLVGTGAGQLEAVIELDDVVDAGLDQRPGNVERERLAGNRAGDGQPVAGAALQGFALPVPRQNIPRDGAGIRHAVGGVVGDLFGV